ncbi:hypothetical protein D9611_002147 [Ephemerocybe angulata]|uniref:Uncharacterized protein n=1 Tax=Ephemerocybe angulata TaxID=980116 RepID=A0A8H5CH57_9AGAR|nr:hypothetical protein D9611_002147 [Tulosesus angulatus]
MATTDRTTTLPVRRWPPAVCYDQGYAISAYLISHNILLGTPTTSSTPGRANPLCKVDLDAICERSKGQSNAIELNDEFSPLQPQDCLVRWAEDRGSSRRACAAVASDDSNALGHGGDLVEVTTRASIGPSNTEIAASQNSPPLQRKIRIASATSIPTYRAHAVQVFSIGAEYRVQECTPTDASVLQTNSVSATECERHLYGTAYPFAHSKAYAQSPHHQLGASPRTGPLSQLRTHTTCHGATLSTPANHDIDLEYTVSSTAPTPVLTKYREGGLHAVWILSIGPASNGPWNAPSPRVDASASQSSPL